MARNKTLYIKPCDEAIVERACKLLAFHEDTTLSAVMAEQCRKIVQKYEPTVESSSHE